MVTGDLADQGHVLAGDPDETAPDASLLDEPRRDPPGGVAGDGETDALGRPDDGGVHPDDAAVRVDQRTTGIARIERGIGLDDVVDQTTRGAAERTPQSTDNARRDRLLESHR